MREMPEHLQRRYDAALTRMHGAIAFDLRHQIGDRDVACDISPTAFGELLDYIETTGECVCAGHAALAEALIRRGVLSVDEYHASLVTTMERRADAAVAKTQEKYELPGVEFA